MHDTQCPGLPADWPNAWLAAIGISSLIPHSTLRWTADPVPFAVLSTESADPLEVQIARRMPTAAEFEASPIARCLDGVPELKLNPSVDDFAARSAIARAHPLGWMLSSLHTDARWDRKDGPSVDKAPFYTPMPGVDNTMYDRIVKLIRLLDRSVIPEPETQIAASLAGVGTRVKQNGIGFDINRVGSLADSTDMYVDPVVDVLALFGLTLFPLRGNGRDSRQRGWDAPRTEVGGFTWFAWSEPLDIDAIDAWLDLAYSPNREAPSMLAAWEVVPYKQRGSQDVTRGFASRRII